MFSAKNHDFVLCLVHAGLWIAFGLTWLALRDRYRHAVTIRPAYAASRSYTASFARSVLAFHLFAFGVLYFGIVKATITDSVLGFGWRGYVASGAMALGAVLIWWAIASLRSWRFTANLQQGHELSTDGAFRRLRHPIYCGINLIAVGSGIWAPTVLTWSGVLLIIVGSDLRARAEEAVLSRAFGESYAEYCSRSSRFLPGIY